MVKINREYVLKTFLDKVREAKRQDMKEIKVPVRFLDDLAYIIVQLMTEELSKAYNSIEPKQKEDIKQVLPIKRKILKEIIPKKLEEIKEEIKEEKKEEIIEVSEIKEEPKEEKKEEIIAEPVKEVEESKNEEDAINDIDENEEDDNTNVMYGGTW